MDGDKTGVKVVHFECVGWELNHISSYIRSADHWKMQLLMCRCEHSIIKEGKVEYNTVRN